MADMRRAKLPANFSYYCGALAGFSERDIERVCQAFEEEVVSDFQHADERFPELGRMLDLCRKAAQSRTEPKSSLSPEMQQYYRDLNVHPEQFVPIQLIVRDTLKLVKWKAEMKANGHPVSDDAMRDARELQADRTCREWREMLAESHDRNAVIKRMSEFRLVEP